MIITCEQIRKAEMAGGCKDAIAWARDGRTWEDAVREQRAFVEWCVDNILPASTWIGYDTAMAKALDEYGVVREKAQANYNKATAPAWEKCKETTAPAWREYNAAVALALATCRWAERAGFPMEMARAGYRAARGAAFSKCRIATAPAMKEYEDATVFAWIAYDLDVAPALLKIIEKWEEGNDEIKTPTR